MGGSRSPRSDDRDDRRRRKKERRDGSDRRERGEGKERSKRRRHEERHKRSRRSSSSSSAEERPVERPAEKPAADPARPAAVSQSDYLSQYDNYSAAPTGSAPVAPGHAPAPQAPAPSRAVTAFAPDTQVTAFYALNTRTVGALIGPKGAPATVAAAVPPPARQHAPSLGRRARRLHHQGSQGADGDGNHDPPAGRAARAARPRHLRARRPGPRPRRRRRGRRVCDAGGACLIRDQSSASESSGAESAMLAVLSTIDNGKGRARRHLFAPALTCRRPDR